MVQKVLNLIKMVAGFEELVQNYGTECLISGASECHKMLNCVQNSSERMGYCNIRELCVHSAGLVCVFSVVLGQNG